MSHVGHVYDWLRGRGYWVQRRGEDTTHLMMDGGMARVPDDAHAAFLNAYAASLVRHPSTPPCLVELKTPTFKMFVDLDTRFPAGTTPQAALEALAPALAVVWRVVAQANAEAAEAVVCAPTQPKVEAGGAHKVGFHVVWPEVLVEAPTAVALRQLMVDALAEEVAPPEGDTHATTASEQGAAAHEQGTQGTAARGKPYDWATIVDASVYRANGLRMPWSAKGRHDARVYRPAATMAAAVELQPVAPIEGVAALREWVRRLSIRTHLPATLTLVAPPAAVDAGAPAAAPMTAMSLAQYADALPALAAALPVQFLGQRFTAVVQPSSGADAQPHSFLLRSTARYCFNLGRAHRTNTVYFVLTRRGVHQRCYCRCETTEGRKYGMCKDFASEVWPVPEDVMRAFFGEDPKPLLQPQRRVPTAVSSMPSRAAKSSLSLDSLIARSRGVTKRGAAPKRRHQQRT